ncbi:hypothetical protein GCM10010358_71940 [Streptomyces minutiscleroticus]|uniref:Uncharacterized protein n=1 Tax=Streptomyces minutiscleroticus TaxID=68238 RepID=A0A918NZK0_9ACTN|nr:hypothetical protein GCM10010358_71940 [Streptomyces minutiscleroticus]
MLHVDARDGSDPPIAVSGVLRPPAGRTPPRQARAAARVVLPRGDAAPLTRCGNVRTARNGPRPLRARLVRPGAARPAVGDREGIRAILMSRVTNDDGHERHGARCAPNGVIPKDTTVVCRATAAGRGELTCEEPDRMNPVRTPDLRPTFGTGPRSPLGRPAPTPYHSVLGVMPRRLPARALAAGSGKPRHQGGTSGAPLLELPVAR